MPIAFGSYPGTRLVNPFSLFCAVGTLQTNPKHFPHGFVPGSIVCPKLLHGLIILTCRLSKKTQKKLMLPSFRRRGSWFVLVRSNCLHPKNKQTHTRCLRSSSRGNRLCDRELRVGSFLEHAPGEPVRGGRNRVKQREKSGSEMKSQQISQLIPQGMTPLDYPICAKGRGFYT